MHLVFTTVGKKKDADKMAKSLVLHKLAACVSSWPVQSTYRWMGKIKKDKEFILEIKTANAKAVMRWMQKNHPYKLPVIYSLKAAGISGAVRKWMKKNRWDYDIKKQEQNPLQAARTGPGQSAGCGR